MLARQTGEATRPLMIDFPLRIGWLWMSVKAVTRCEAGTDSPDTGRALTPKDGRACQVRMLSNVDSFLVLFYWVARLLPFDVAGNSLSSDYFTNGLQELAQRLSKVKFALKQ